MPEKVWRIGCEIAKSAEQSSAIVAMAEALGITPAFAKVLYLRGYDTAEKAKNFLCMSDTVLYDPFLMKDMRRAAEGILEAVAENKNIAIYGDYDADGVSSVSMLFLYLEKIAPELKLGYYIPDRRTEGYGVSSEAIGKLAAKGVELIITVDTGISAVREVEYARELGVRVIVTDHHECPAILPDAQAVVNPHQPGCEYPFKDLAGVGVAFKLITAIETLRRRLPKTGREVVEDIYREYSDLAALGTVADVMPVIGENRMIISYGLSRIREHSRPGIDALLEKANPGKGGAVTSSTVAFALAPRINAAGRMNKASKAVELMLLSYEDTDCRETAELIADALCEYNKERQTEEARISEQVYAEIETKHRFGEDHFIVADGDGWHAGVIGIVASRVTEKYHLPSFLITYGDVTDGMDSPFDVGTGSGRSIDGVNLVEALAGCADCLIKSGGHELAAGLSVTRGNVPELRRRLNEYVKKMPPETWEMTVSAECELEASDLTLTFARELQTLEPCGNANPVPVFYLGGAKIVKSYGIGGGKHLKLVLEKDGILLSGVMFNADYDAFNFNPGEEVDVMFNADINEYNHVTSVQLLIREMRYSETYMRQYKALEKRYSEVVNGEEFAPKENFIPDRADFARLYTLFARLSGEEKNEIPLRQLLSLLNAGNDDKEKEINLVKCRLMFDIFGEMGLCETEMREFDLVDFRVLPTKEKVDLDASVILSRLKEKCSEKSGERFG